MKGGWIALRRDIRAHWIWTDPERLKWWLDLLLMAAPEPRRVIHDGREVDLDPGQLIASRYWLSNRWDRSQQTIWTFLQRLEADGMITRERISSRITVITIAGYADMAGEPDDPAMWGGLGHEAAPAPAGDEGGWFARAVADDEFMGRLSEILGGSRGALEALARRFETERVAKGHTYPNLDRYKEHLINWGRYNRPANENSLNNENETKRQQRRNAACSAGGSGAAVAGRPDPRRPLPAGEWNEQDFERPF